MPRAARELEAARQEASFLRRHMENVKLGLEDVEAKTNNSIKGSYSQIYRSFFIILYEIILELLDT